MKLKRIEAGRRTLHFVPIAAGLALVLTLSAHAQTQAADTKVSEANSAPGTYQTLYLTNLMQQKDAAELVTDLRNILPKARLYYVQSQRAISVRGTPEDILLAQKMLSDLDRTGKVYRLTYTIAETDGGKSVGTQRFALIVASGERTDLKQGSRVPVITGTSDPGTSTQNSQVQYLDVGLSIEASVEGSQDGARLHTKVEQSRVAEEKPGVGVPDPVVQQTVLEGTSILVQGKPLVLGSLDIPGSTRHQEIEVVSELVR